MAQQYPTSPDAGQVGLLERPAGSAPVHHAAQRALAEVLDHWLAQAIDLMSAQARATLHADGLAPARFALIGTRRQHAIAGRIVASSDRPGRHVPFLMMSSIEVPEPAVFVPDAPLVLGRLWRCLESFSVSATGAGVALPATGPGAGAAPGASTYAAGFVAFLQLHSMADLDALLAEAGYWGSTAQLMAALGQLLQPVLDKDLRCLDNSLVLPLPHDDVYCNLVAAFWMHLVTPFLARTDRELALFITRIDKQPALVIGFHGAAPLTLCAVLDPQSGLARHIRLDQVHGGDALAAQLAQSALSLKAAQEFFYATYFGR